MLSVVDVNNSGCVLQILGASSAFQATIHDEAHDAFMTLSPYTRTKEGEAHHLSSGSKFCWLCL